MSCECKPFILLSQQKRVSYLGAWNGKGEQGIKIIKIINQPFYFHSTLYCCLESTWYLQILSHFQIHGGNQLASCWLTSPQPSVFSNLLSHLQFDYLLSRFLNTDFTYLLLSHSLDLWGFISLFY